MGYSVLWQEFNSLYRRDEDLLPLIERLKWPCGFNCYSCGHRTAYRIATRNLPLYECAKCKYQQSLTAHTIMHKSRTSIRKWLFVMYLVGKYERSINAVQLSGLLDLSYKTAWRMLNKIRSVLSVESAQLWGENVEIKHEVFNLQTILTDDRLQKERSVAIVQSITRDERDCDSSFIAFRLLDRSKQARENLEYTEQANLLLQLNLSCHNSVEVNPRFQQFQRKPAEESSIPKRTCHPLSSIAITAFSWMKDMFHGIGIKYAQQYMDEYCLRLNASTGAIKCAFEHTLRLSLQRHH
ncbi:hypothetical protein D3P09_18905 [Paenibacillus pinisoli]|uniref:Transposase zinc-ribbon domain-containing protein n=2 Tax=Paenibacillus pinisoli TaxID=1276110 RepID=A0A3A6PGT1_9BACL|nr:hypothetical protein D3P09_18905 [Paenibacillus pinisoli]